MGSLEDNRDAVIEMIDRTARPLDRILIGLAGPPGSGKSTLAESVVTHLNQRACSRDEAALLPMDGFHLDNELLKQRNLLHRKGTPETFDAEGLVELLINVKAGVGDIHYPLFDRALDHSLIDAGLLKADTKIVVVEGNYLLLDAPVWNQLIDLFDASVFLSPSRSTLEERLMSRWLGLGFSEEDARRKAHGNDMINADTVLMHSLRADLTLAECTRSAGPTNVQESQ